MSDLLRAPATFPRGPQTQKTTAFVDELDIFIVPQINGDGAAHSLYDSNRRKNLSN